MKKLISIAIAAILVFTFSPAVAYAEQNYSGGPIPTSGVLSKSESPFLITKPFQVMEGQTLFVQPGVEILANFPANALGRFLFEMHGTLILGGTDKD